MKLNFIEKRKQEKEAIKYQKEEAARRKAEEDKKKNKRLLIGAAALFAVLLIVNLAMFFCRDEPKILNSVIVLVTVDMVNDFCRQKGSTQMLFHHGTVNRFLFATHSTGFVITHLNHILRSECYIRLRKLR